MKKEYPRDEKYFPEWIEHSIMEINAWFRCMGITSLKDKIMYIYRIMSNA